VDKGFGEKNVVQGQLLVMLERTPKPKDVYYGLSYYLCE
jgi:hypothetical protein